MNEELIRTRVILDEKIEERLPLNYDVIQELIEKTNKLYHSLYLFPWQWNKLDMDRYVTHLTITEVLCRFSIGFVIDLSVNTHLKEITGYFLAYRELFNLITDKDRQTHVEPLNSCADPSKAWELFNRIEYLINNFETEILLSDTEDTEDVGY